MVQKDIRAAGSGRSSDLTMNVACGLGWFSIGLGLAEIASPHTLTQALGMEGKEPLLRAYGARELAAGAGIILSQNPAPWVWGRVAGDIQDLATLATGIRENDSWRTNVVLALVAVAGITVLDALCAKALSSNTRTSDRAIRDYSRRSGFPKPPEAMRGVAARSFQVPKDMRTPEPMRAFTSQSASDQPAMEHSRA